DSSIGQGRGMIRWAPFATMPEEFETGRRLVDDQLKISRPELSEDRLEEMGRRLKKERQDKRKVKEEYYYDGKHYNNTITIITQDRWSMMLIRQNKNSPADYMVFISFMDILDIMML